MDGLTNSLRVTKELCCHSYSKPQNNWDLLPFTKLGNNYLSALSSKSMASQCVFGLKRTGAVHPEPALVSLLINSGFQWREMNPCACSVGHPMPAFKSRCYRPFLITTPSPFLVHPLQMIPLYLRNPSCCRMLP